MRLQLDISEALLQEVTDVMETTGIETRKDLFNNALTLFQWAVDEVKSGRRIASVDSKTGEIVKELHMPSLSKAAIRSGGGE